MAIEAWEAGQDTYALSPENAARAAIAVLNSAVEPFAAPPKYHEAILNLEHYLEDNE